MAAVDVRRRWSWLWVVLAALYFFVPLIATFLFSLREQKGRLGFLAYRHVFADPQFIATFGFSLEMAALTIAASFLLIIPTAIFVHLRLPRLRAVMDGLALMPFVIPPIVLAFGLIRIYSRPPFALAASPLLLVAGYVVIAFPYTYRAVDNGLRAIDLRTLVEAAQSLGSRWIVTVVRVVVPNVRAALLSAAFLTLAIVIGELTLAIMLAWPAFGPYMALVGRDLAYEPAALAVLSFVLTWASVAAINLLGRGRNGAQAAAGGPH